MPSLTIKEIEIHRKSSEKYPGLVVVQILDCNKKFKEGREVYTDSITTSMKGNEIHIK